MKKLAFHVVLLTIAQPRCDHPTLSMRLASTLFFEHLHFSFTCSIWSGAPCAGITYGSNEQRLSMFHIRYSACREASHLPRFAVVDGCCAEQQQATPSIRDPSIPFP